jgi:hypothetical protein
MRRILAVTTLAMVAGAALSGCGGTREALGLDKKPAPDEFQVTTRQPLALPPNYQLRPPQPGAQPLEAAVTEQAKQTVFGRDPSQTQGQAIVPVGTRNAVAAPLSANAPAIPGFARRSAGEQALLSRAGASSADPNIRILVDRDSQQIADANKSLVDDLLFWRKPQEAGVMIDADKEAERLKQNQAAGKTPTEGDTPTIKRRSRGVLDGLIN